MPTSNVYNRTAIFCKEKKEDGSIRRIKRIPWDLINFPSSESGLGPFISPMPVCFDALADTVITDDINPNTVDMLFEDNDPGQIDEVVDIMWVESERAFYAQFENTFGYYDGEESQSEEFGL